MDILDEVCVELKRANSLHAATFNSSEGARRSNSTGGDGGQGDHVFG